MVGHLVPTSTEPTQKVFHYHKNDYKIVTHPK